jgi:hypothetical protein
LITPLSPNILITFSNFYQKGKSWSEKAEEVNTYDFPQDATGKAIPK